MLGQHYKIGNSSHKHIHSNAHSERAEQETKEEGEIHSRLEMGGNVW